jgi:hypothetical protein
MQISHMMVQLFSIIGPIYNNNRHRSPSLFYLFTAGVEVVLFSLDNTQTHTTVGRTPLDKRSARRRDL